MERNKIYPCKVFWYQTAGLKSRLIKIDVHASLHDRTEFSSKRDRDEIRSRAAPRTGIEFPVERRRSLHRRPPSIAGYSRASRSSSSTSLSTTNLARSLSRVVPRARTTPACLVIYTQDDGGRPGDISPSSVQDRVSVKKEKKKRKEN